MSTQTPSVLELAVYTVHEPDSFGAIQRQTHQAITTLQGNRGSLALCGRTGGLFADLVAWESLEAARVAADAVRMDSRFAPLMTAISQLRLYAHYVPSVNAETVLGELRSAPFVEVAAYAVADVVTHAGLQSLVHRALRAEAGYRGGTAARQHEDPRQFADFLGWENEVSHDRANETLQAREEFQPFFAGISEMSVFELFRVLE